MEAGQAQQPAENNSAEPTCCCKSWLCHGWRILRLPLIACLVLLVLLMIFEETFIFYPMKYPAGTWKVEGLELEDVWFEAEDGTKLHGWYVPHENPRALVLYCHGNAGNITHRADILRALHDRVGVSVLIFDYRGYGRSEGKPDEQGVLADTRAARAWLARRELIPEGEEAETIVLMGRSLGAAVAVDLAATDGARALVLESTFTSIPDMAGHVFPWLPVRPLVRTKLDSLEKIGDYHGPLLQSHGDADSIIPFKLGQRLFEAANEPKHFITLQGFDHNDFQPSTYYDQLTDFIDQLPD